MGPKMSYPTLEQYNEAFQHPQLALTDPELKQGSIATTGLGLPLALCGGFALTYTVKTSSKKYAVRCFHKQSNGLEKRYSSISSSLKTLRSPYFVDFEFQPQGVKVVGKAYPVVKMAWATGTTLGEFLEQRYRNPGDLQQLAASLNTLAKFLRDQNMAHGDIQPGNVMIADAGKKIQLIDYDGMFVEDLRSLGSAELGHRNFQHPKRSNTSWDPSLDRFSFIGLALATRALQSHPELWAKTQSDGDSILFKANDFADPSRSAIFSDLFNRPQFADDAKNFAAICKAAFDKIPTLEDFLAKKNIPQVSIAIIQAPASAPAQYLSAYPVLDGTSYAACLAYVGDKVELIGQIVEVKQDTTRHGKPYVFINFGPWQGHIVKVSIWSEGLDAISNKPTQNWVGKWISVIGLMEPPYASRRYKYSHLAISITQGNQFHLLSEQDAKFRLAGSSSRSGTSTSRSNNREILDGIRGVSTSRPGGSVQRASAPVTSNQAVLQKMKVSQPAPHAGTGGVGSYSGKQRPTPSSSSKSKCFIATAVYGVDAPETNVLRNWRDTYLLQSRIGQTFVATYYKISPLLVPVLARQPWLRRLFKKALDRLVRLVR